MTHKRDRTQTRATVLQAAERIVLRDGASALTLDAVAREATVSKGGVLYHFPTKDALIAAMIDHISDRFELEIEARLKQLPASPGRWTRAYLDASLDEDSWTDEINTTANAGLLAAIATSPDMLAPLRVRYARWQAQIEVNGIDPSVGTLIRMAVDGLWIAALLDLAPPDAATRAQLHSQLVHLIERGKGIAP